MRLRFVSALAIGMAGFAQASYDLMLIGVNQGANTRVARWDPVNRVSLGSFGQGILSSVQDVAVNQATGTAYVLTGGRVAAFNYSSGELLGVSSVSIGNANTLQYNSATNLLTFGEGSGSGIIASYNLNGDLSSNSILFGSTYSSSAALARAGRYYAMTLEGAVPYNLSATTWSSTGSFLGVTGTGIAWNNTNGLHDAAFLGTKLYGVQYDTGANQTAIWTSETSSGLALTPLKIATLHNTIGGRRSIANAHGGGFWLTAGNVLTSYNPNLGFGPDQSLASLGTASELSGMCVIIAPEPSSVLAFAVGGLCLLRRRKQA